MNLAEKIRARLDEDEWVIQVARSGGYEPDIWEIEPSRSGNWSHIVAKSRLIGEPISEAAREDDQPVAVVQSGRWEDKHIARYDPASMLRLIAGLRKILNERDDLASQAARSDYDTDEYALSVLDDVVLPALADALGIDDETAGQES